MRRLVAFAAVALLVLAAVPLAQGATTTTTTKSIAGNIVATPTGGNGIDKFVFRFEVRTQASGAVQFGYYQADGLGSALDRSSQATVDNVRFFRDTVTGAKAAQFGGMECNLVSGVCGAYALIVSDGSPDTFCGGPPEDPCKFTFDVLFGDISIVLGSQNTQ